MFKKGTKLYSILNFKCPACHEGKFFTSHPYNLKNAGQVYENCPVCDEKFSKEPGFYYGAMYVSYALGVAMFVAIYLAIRILYPSASVTIYIFGIIASMIILGPLLYSLSKIIWANMFIKYKEDNKTIKTK